ncbi:OmpH family outer membrane protein [Balneolaceae bacterium]|nr:OmpH family outer membrane protein [Balneolaceae bacterium]
MKQHFIFSALLWIFLLTIEAQAQIKIGYMNPSVVLSQLDEVAIVEQQIEQLVQQRDTELMSKANQLQQDFVAYEEARSMLNEEARIIREEDLLARDQQLQEERENYLNEITQKRALLLQPIIEKMDQVMAEVAQEKGLDLILNEATSFGDAIVFFSAEQLNITQEVLSRMITSGNDSEN